MSTLNINQFQQNTVRGALDQNISKSGLIPCVVGTSQTLKPGDRVKLDTSNTGPMPVIVAAGQNDLALGVVSYDVKRSTFTDGDIAQVAYFGGPVMYLVAGATILPQALVEDNGDGTVITKSGNKEMGIALDPGTSGNLLRVILVNPSVD